METWLKMSRGEEKPLDDLLPHFCSRSPYPFPRHPGGGRGGSKLFFSSCSPCASIKQGIILSTHPSLRRSAKSSPNQTSFLLTKDFSPFCYTYIQLIFIDKIRIPSDCPQISQLINDRSGTQIPETGNELLPGTEVRCQGLIPMGSWKCLCVHVF